ncbi:MAG TPA: hypothetical protein VET65_01720 [Candidatus Limnocylindrales bacterium]|nr:hypothetical protein [Candidatus Limnocylindrales bacterium]
MGVIQTFYYLAIISSSLVILALIFVAIAVRELRRLFREGDDPLTAWLVAGATALVFVFVIGTTAGILIGVVSRGSS